jgi:DNA-binding NtrC family response regulator
MRRLEERHVVVFVDDEPEVLSALKRSLRREPYQVLTTKHPEDVLRWVRTLEVSAVVSDERMPEMTGTELLARVGEDSPGTARIILTAYPGPTAQVPRLRQSIECMIGKPWDDAMLRRTLREFLSEREREEPERFER